MALLGKNAHLSHVKAMAPTIKALVTQ